MNYSHEETEEDFHHVRSCFEKVQWAVSWSKRRELSSVSGFLMQDFSANYVWGFNQ
jgi:hypothetical protein